MKYFYLFFIALVFAGCSSNKVDITGTAVGIKDGRVSLKDGSGQHYNKYLKTVKL
jgi:hypothetical protein